MEQLHINSCAYLPLYRQRYLQVIFDIFLNKKRFEKLPLLQYQTSNKA